jgi:hypothetical protein
VALPPPPPLRTVRASFPAYGSSIGQRMREDTRLPLGLGVHLDGTTAGPATELPTVAEAAPAKVVATTPSSGLASCAGSRRFTYANTRGKSAHLRVRCSCLSPRLPPLSARLPDGLRFLPPPLPAVPSASLASHVPTFHNVGGLWAYYVPLGYRPGLGRASTPVGRHLRARSSEPRNLPTYRLVQA